MSAEIFDRVNEEHDSVFITAIALVTRSVWEAKSLDELTASIPSCCPPSLAIERVAISWGTIPEQADDVLPMPLPGLQGSAYVTFEFSSVRPRLESAFTFLSTLSHLIAFGVDRLSHLGLIDDALVMLSRELADHKQQVKCLQTVLQLVAGMTDTVLRDIGLAETN